MRNKNLFFYIYRDSYTSCEYIYDYSNVRKYNARYNLYMFRWTWKAKKLCIPEPGTKNLVIPFLAIPYRSLAPLKNCRSSNNRISLANVSFAKHSSKMLIFYRLVPKQEKTTARKIRVSSDRFLQLSLDRHCWKRKKRNVPRKAFHSRSTDQERRCSLPLGSWNIEKQRREGRVSSDAGSRTSGRQKCVLTSRRTRRLYPCGR